MNQINMKAKTGSHVSEIHTPPGISETLHFLILLSSVILPLFFLSCYSSTAVKGIPVKDLVAAEDKRIFRESAPKEDKETIISMSNIKKNESFADIEGMPEYRIGPLDVLEINSHIGDKVTKTSVTVDNRGRISYSFIDDIPASGLTPSQLDRIISEKLSHYIKNPRIDVLVTEFNSKSATVLGELASLRSSNLAKAASGRIYLKGKTTLMDLIAMAGGYTVDADIKNVQACKGRKALSD